jgi:hypothetical protein
VGEHLLNKMAQQLLVMAAHHPRDLRLGRPAVSPGPLTELTAGWGTTVAALEAAGELSPLSPVPGQLAALCASLGVTGHEITAAPAPRLPEPWLSMLAHYRRRKPGLAPARDGAAAVATALPELAGIRLVLLGVYNSEGRTCMAALALGPMPDQRRALPGPDRYFPFSVWVHDCAGRWHIASPVIGSEDNRGQLLMPQLVPPLARATTWIEVLAAGPSAEVRARLPLRWQ